MTCPLPGTQFCPQTGQSVGPAATAMAQRHQSHTELCTGVLVSVLGGCDAPAGGAWGSDGGWTYSFDAVQLVRS